MHAEDDESFFSSGSESAEPEIEQTSGGSSDLANSTHLYMNGRQCMTQSSSGNFIYTQHREC